MSSFTDVPPTQRPAEDQAFHSLDDPLGFPLAFKNWIVQYVQQELHIKQIPGYAAATFSNAIVPATTLPASPTDGQPVVYTDNLATPTYAWSLVWSAAAAKWIFTGGSPIVAADLTFTARAIAGAAYATYTGAPSITLPRAGDYYIRVIGMLSGTTNTSNLFLSYAVGGTGALDGDSISMGGPLPSGTMKASGIGGPSLKTGLAASTVIACQAKATAGTGNVINSVLEVVPRSVT